MTSVDDAALVRGTIANDSASWGELVRRHSGALRRALIDAGQANEADVDDAMGELWLSLIEDNHRRLREFDPSRGVTLSAWLAMRAALVSSRSSAETVEAPARGRLRLSTLMRVEEVAERWDLNPKTVYAMIARGELVSRRCGRVIRVPRRVVESFERASVEPDRKKQCR